MIGQGGSPPDCRCWLQGDYEKQAFPRFNGGLFIPIWIEAAREPSRGWPVLNHESTVSSKTVVGALTVSVCALEL